LLTDGAEPDSIPMKVVSLFPVATREVSLA